jgi:succinate-semialdehyde dehydrogenase/glutarate-semialdehyde dehydrogenase
LYQSINPATNIEIKSYKSLDDEQLFEKLSASEATYNKWRFTEFSERSVLMTKLADALINSKEVYAEIITSEMGKPISEAIAEIEKCATVCKYYAENAEGFLKAKELKSDHKRSFISYEPLGIIYAIMPWNFPFWQVIRCAVPAIMAGNTIVLKHAENVPQCAEALEELFSKAGFMQGIFTQLMISHEQSDKVIEYEAIRGISLTGSERAGSAVAQNAGRVIKRTILELGGSDPFIVLRGANISLAAETGVKSRMQNAGQSCIAAKRFILEESIAEEFLRNFIKYIEAIKVGNPADPSVNMGPLARKDLVETIEKQVSQSVEMGAKILCGGERIKGDGNYFKPTVLINIAKGSPAYKDELFGPVASVFAVANEDEAIKIANDTSFGLGASLWTNDIEKAIKLAGQIESGNVYINAIVKSDARLPFGGIKHSGYGRELSEVGIHEFVNIKTVCLD